MGSTPQRVLHVVYAMNTGGIESWLMSLYRNIDRDRLQFDFLVNVKTDSFFDAEITKLGGSIIYGGKLNNPVDIYFRTKTLLKIHSYSAIHCHNVENAFPALYAAKNIGLTVRLYHCHNNVNRKWGLFSKLKRQFLKISNNLAIKCSSKLLSVSKECGDILFGSNEYQQISLGIELQKYLPEKKNKLNKNQFGLSDDDLIIGHVGRFDLQKNHTFIVKIANEIIKELPNAKFVLVGDGKLEREIREEVDNYNLDKHFVFLGLRSDVPQLMLDIMDVFIFPSLFEGLGLVVVEAQAAGLPVICSNMVPTEAIVNKNIVKICDLSSSEISWASTTIEFYKNCQKTGECDALSVILKSDFNLSRTLSSMESLWLEKK
jgi:glycosyltransferase involved in cell wall biosynthesis